MKKKLINVLLALIVCIGLAVPVFAEPAEELPMPEETQVLTAEEAPVLSDLVVENGGSKWTIGHLHCVEEYETEEPLDGTEGGEMVVTKWQVGYRCSDKSCPYLQNSQTVDTLSVASEEVPVNCSVCGAYNWKLMWNEVKYDDIENPTTHIVYFHREYRCQTAGCSGWAAHDIPITTAAHSWQKGSFVKYQSNDSTHTAVYNYSCVCGAEKTGEDPAESHSMSNAGYKGSNYHRGTLHYIGYQYSCAECGYTETRYESTPCPGNNNGEGCVFFINKVEPPDEEMSTAPGETAVPDDGESVE